VTAPDDSRLYEWAEFNLPAELLDRPRSVSPLARRVLAGDPRVPGAIAAAASPRAFQRFASLLLPFGFRTLPKS
jgi:hypothetical protein